MPTKGAAQANKRLEHHIRMQALRKKLMNNPKWRNQQGIVIAEYNGGVVAVRVVDKLDAHVLTEEDFNKSEEVVEMNPSEKKLTKAEKRELAMKLAGSAKFFSYEGLKESDRIANREDWEEESE